MKGKSTTSVTSDFSNDLLQNHCNQNIHWERYIVGFMATVVQHMTLFCYYSFDDAM